MNENRELIIINCPPWGTVMPPLGIACLSSYLRGRGFSLAVKDLNNELFRNAAQEREWWKLSTINQIPPPETARRLFDFCLSQSEPAGIEEYRVVGFSANNLTSTLFAGMMAKEIKSRYPDKLIVVGGPGCYHGWDRNPADNGCVDFFVIGEGELVLENILLQLRHQGRVDRPVPGLLAGKGRKLSYLPAASVVDLDSLGHPDFREFDLKDYGTAQGYRPLPMLISRGCVNRCSYCIDWYMNRPFRCRSAGDVVDEIESYVTRYGVTHLEFNDLLCNGNLPRLNRICDGIIDKGIKVSWISYAAIRKNFRSELMEKMREAGCQSLCYGLESGSDAVLRRMNKHYTREDARRVIQETAKAGISVSVNLIVGFPGETEDDFLQTLSFVKENQKTISQVTNVSSFILMPGSDLFVFPNQFKVQIDPDDPGRWTDEHGLTQTERNDRVRRTKELLAELKIPNLIINCQSRETAYEPASLAGNPISSKSRQLKAASPAAPGRGALKLVMLGVLVLAGLVIDLYLTIIKKMRGSVIFPGN